MLHFDYLFFFNDTATTEIYTLSLHDALPICRCPSPVRHHQRQSGAGGGEEPRCPARPVTTSRSGCSRSSAWSCCSAGCLDRKSTRLNSSHANISYAVFCLKKKQKKMYWKALL